MKIISFDMGLRHLACCEIVQTSFKEFSIGHWTVESCIPEDVNVNATSLECMIAPFVDLIRGLLRKFDNPDCQVIESQPMGHGRSFGGTSMGGSPRNLKTKVLSHVLQALLHEKNIESSKAVPIHFISPTLKMKECTIPFKSRTYRDNKKQAVEKTVSLLKEYSNEETLKLFLECPAKKDDLADSFLQGQTVCKCIENKSLILESPHFQMKASKSKSDKRSRIELEDKLDKDIPKSAKKVRKAKAKDTVDAKSTELKVDVKKVELVPRKKKTTTKKVAASVADFEDS